RSPQWWSRTTHSPHRQFASPAYTAAARHLCSLPASARRIPSLFPCPALRLINYPSAAGLGLKSRDKSCLPPKIHAVYRRQNNGYGSPSPSTANITNCILSERRRVRSGSGGPFFAQDAHVDQIVVSAVRPDMIAQAAFFGKTDCLICSDGTLVFAMHPQKHFVQITMLKGVIHQQADRLAPIAFAPVGFVADGDSKLAGMRSRIKVEQRAAADQLAIGFN